MVVTLNDVDVQLAFCGREEDTLVDFELEAPREDRGACLDPGVMVEGIRIRTLSTPFPKSSNNVPAILVFLPAPEGP